MEGWGWSMWPATCRRRPADVITGCLFIVCVYERERDRQRLRLIEFACLKSYDVVTIATDDLALGRGATVTMTTSMTVTRCFWSGQTGTCTGLLWGSGCVLYTDDAVLFTLIRTWSVEFTSITVSDYRCLSCYPANYPFPLSSLIST